MVDVISFEDALGKTNGERRHLLLGNGFSIALFPERFTYRSLLEEAKEEGFFEAYPELQKAFEILKTTDFEVVLQALSRMRRLLHLYVDSPDPVAKIADHVEHLKEGLVGAIAGKHPARLGEISERQFTAARTFLAKFAARSLKNRGCIYTLNYDLLLYWTLMHDPRPVWDGTKLIPPEDALYLASDDGFRAPDDDYDAPYVAWDVDGGSNTQNVHFLHGGLHLYDAGSELQKICWERSGGIPLMDQIRDALDQDRYPLFVSEGNADSKQARILHSGYLTRSFKSFAAICQKRTTNLFVYGHSLAESDNHILRLIEEGCCPALFVSLYGDPANSDNMAMVQRAEALAGARAKYKLDVFFFDAESAHVWG
ncbi:DUF4917 domain-containing protein [Sphingosinicella humi]|uniref:DUF4917 domain-containing protein n=1 Tax=Allosphingosinicella humi TaxID=2068657 RepID=A0A2U2J6D5_9SPHN|nr:DUF4917 domain-containing protein [Sphingosinicella humi]